MSNTKPFPLSAFDSLSDGQPIAAVQGRIVKLFDQKTGESSVGPWQLQNAEIEADGVVVPVMFKDRDPLDRTMKNRTILLTASNVKGMAGIYAFDDTRNGATVRKIKVTASATLDIIQDGGNQAPVNQEPTTALHQPPTGHVVEQPANNPPQQAAQPKQAPPAGNDVLAAKKTIMQILNLHLLCAEAVEKVEAPAFKKATGHDLSESQRQGAIASVFIESCRTGLVRNMPTSLIP